MIVGLSLILSACAHAQLATPSPSPTPFPTNPWSEVTTPTNDRPNPVGFYSSGCLAGASVLPLDGEGYQAMKIFRNRYYGHPDLIRYISSLAKTLKALKSGLLIGDMAQPRGGPLPYGHASHQVGLDVDIWFWTHPEQNIRPLTEDERNNLPPISMLNANGIVDTNFFKEEQIKKLEIASADPRVERIFVNPAIKTFLCATLPLSALGPKSWLHKLRPWPGHDEHFHVRLSCPANLPGCEHQDPIDLAGDGCSEVIPPRHSSGILAEEGKSIPVAIAQAMHPDLPKECADILNRK